MSIKPTSFISYGIVSFKYVFEDYNNFCAFWFALLYLSLWNFMAYLRALFSIRFFSILSPVIGLLSFSLNHFWITSLSKL